MFKFCSLSRIGCSLKLNCSPGEWYGLCVIAELLSSCSIVKTLEKKCPTLSFSMLLLTTTGLPCSSTLFKSPIPILDFHLLLIYFQKAFGFCLHWVATLRCSTLCNLCISFIVLFRTDLYFSIQFCLESPYI